jgi:hypothetical protein
MDITADRQHVWLPPENRDTQNLAEVGLGKGIGNERRMESVSFSAGDRIYELKLVYPTGFEASQELLNAFIVMVNRFRLDNPNANVQKS